MMPARFLGLGLALAVLTTPLAAQEPPKGSWDGLIEVKSSRFDDAFLLPGADFRGYETVMLDPAEVAFRKDWMRNMNNQRQVSGRVTEADAKRILSLVQADTGEIFAKAFNKAGFQVVDAPSEKTLRVTPAIVNLYVNAPDVMSASRVMTFTTETGEATLVLELRDSLTNALLARVVDRRVAQTMGSVGFRPAMSSSVTNKADFERVANSWASASVKGLEALKAGSPVPAVLKPGQKLK
jgi:hypothetical protein